ncbi:alpha-amylase family glycosyl hydrolase [Microcystis aeruginosa]|uniref:alpha-amylase family glycosyl hydrolase n=1 Tax=Microcystis aeruginosa TaxID=1126 RepID=UPI00287F4CEF|nr:alpha-amylase family glycosyl hydrolase [Microcystis aeruginosa]WNF16481.1 alpha-amylase family glycosyl hydrolase [Microcystis aeruginosa NRERC-214]
MTTTVQRLSQLNFASLSPAGGSFPSPIAWEDQAFYFLMLDRFSDGRENGYKDNEGNLVRSGTTPAYSPAGAENAVKTEADAARWREAGVKYVGGTLKGLESKIGYLKRLGVTALWISPIFKQVRFRETYHGYGIQNFLEVEPHFGSREDLREVVRTAHANGIYVVLDIILNHAGNVFSYSGEQDRPWTGEMYPVEGFNDKNGNPTIPFAKPDPQNPPDYDGALFPVELQDPDTFTRKGYIKNWDYDPEFREGDFFDLKDIDHGYGSADDYQVSPALRHLCEAYKYWIAYADIDGFRIDTVKHMDMGATRYFVSVIREFAQSIGKENFFLLGEITGGRKRAYETLELTGLSAALGIDDIPDKLEYLVKGYRNPNDYFSLFRNSELVNKGSHIWFRNKVVTSFDDHDQVRKGNQKARFCADADASKVALNVLALNALTLGIPCIYYGSEQCFDGRGESDRYIRESMFGGEFGAFRTRGLHFFNEDHPVYRELAKILEIRRQNIVLRRGRQYLRSISSPDDGVRFSLPEMVGGQIRSLVPWSRIFNGKEVLLAINTDYDQPRTAWVTVDNELHQAGDGLKCLYSKDAAQIGQSVTVEARNGKAVLITVPAAGFVIFE